MVHSSMELRNSSSSQPNRTIQTLKRCLRKIDTQWWQPLCCTGSAVSIAIALSGLPGYAKEQHIPLEEPVPASHHSTAKPRPAGIGSSPTDPQTGCQFIGSTCC
ncbi:hypothetical protein K9N68_34230 (plasmid) [Kovacikia minuta CCNUW1]|uniref:hypothetical protein n=1 Tax=Kovacikia minuta TaxID=2931930 RepID=UPI001CCFD8CC|nr:hypothetical protein [Kovacikia minuta]UBF30276.1 hypothetical protein K9N68_34230 [Kovacikia minuta CCNUW1]